ncbi:ROK family transcriptional regulator [Nesterenkonia sp. F]|uniref:ROK family transcriptional regulator n=1 Tax=Nesterenkonia sp. F TaxID=795955 RepID=UPI000255D77E|nr:ROK family transcriptional regulator [Nesterenkonia sp. F]
MTPHTADRAASTQQVRRSNARRVLGAMWESGPVTAAELMHATGLTRATVLAICRDLEQQGWIAEASDARPSGARGIGRPALHYVFRADAGHVVGVDAGQHRISAVVADLRGREVGRAEHTSADPEGEDPVRRRAEILAAVDAALAEAGIAVSAVRAVVLGIPAPVDAAGRSPVGHRDYWRRMNPDLATLGADRGWTPVVENDANLAALAELDAESDAGIDAGVDAGTEAGHAGRAGRTEESFAALLSGERFGSGLVFHGELLRQVHGGVGEMGFLTLVDGVGRPHGLGWIARELAREGLEAGRGSGPGGRLLGGRGPDEVRAEHVLRAAAEGEAFAVEIVEELGERLARICAVLGGLLDLDRVIVSGAVARALGDVVAAARRRLPALLDDPRVEIEASTLGGAAVRRGAVHLAVRQVRAAAPADDAA